MSDYHEMATHLRMQEERSLLLENHACMMNNNGHRSGIGKQQFSYSDYKTEKKVGIDFSILPERKTD